MLKGIKEGMKSGTICHNHSVSARRLDDSKMTH